MRISVVFMVSMVRRMRRPNQCFWYDLPQKYLGGQCTGLFVQAQTPIPATCTHSNVYSMARCQYSKELKQEPSHSVSGDKYIYMLMGFIYARCHGLVPRTR